MSAGPCTGPQYTRRTRGRNHGIGTGVYVLPANQLGKKILPRAKRMKLRGKGKR